MAGSSDAIRVADVLNAAGRDGADAGPTILSLVRDAPPTRPLDSFAITVPNETLRRYATAGLDMEIRCEAFADEAAAREAPGLVRALRDAYLRARMFEITPPASRRRPTGDPGRGR